MVAGSLWVCIEPGRDLLFALTIEGLAPRVLQSTVWDYWESVMVMHLGDDWYESFVKYRTGLLAEFDKLGDVRL